MLLRIQCPSMRTLAIPDSSMFKIIRECSKDQSHE
jgi:hypothetical protein